MMKTKILLLVIALMPLTVNAQLEVQPKAAFEYAIGSHKFAAYIPLLHEYYRYEYDFGHYRAKMGIEFNYGNVSLEFDNHFYMHNLGDYRFSPVRADFFTTLTYNVTSKIKIYASHLCIHPVVTSGVSTQYITGGYTSFGVSYGY